MRLLKYMYGITNSGNIFSDELTEWFLEASFIKSQFQMYTYCKYTEYGTEIVVLYYVDDCVYWYTTENIGK